MAFTLETFLETNPNNPDDASDSDVVNFWITSSADGGINRVFILGLTVPTSSVTNGNMTRYLEEAQEVIIEFFDDLGNTKYYRLPIETRKKQPAYYYMELSTPVQIASGSVAQYDNDDDPEFFPYFTLGFDPSNEEKFKDGPYDVTMNLVNTSRRSKKRIKVDRESYSPLVGSFQDFFVPMNYESISSSFTDDIRDEIPERIFSQVQDTNYTSRTWSDIRYRGVDETNNSITGSEPSLFYQKFSGVIFPSSSEDNTIRSFFSTSLDQISSQDIYYTNIGHPGSGTKGYNSLYYSNSNPVSLQYSFYSDNPRFKQPGSNISTILYTESENNSNRFSKIVNSKVYSVDDSKIFKTNEFGRIQEE